MFRRQKIHRLSTALVVVLSLLFSQLVMANYVCPSESAMAEESSVMDMASGQPCEGMAAAPDEQQPALCFQHCASTPQSFDPLHLPTVSLPAIVQVLAVPLVLDAGAADAGLHAEAGQARPPPDPLFLSTLRLRV